MHTHRTHMHMHLHTHRHNPLAVGLLFVWCEFRIVCVRNVSSKALWQSLRFVCAVVLRSIRIPFATFNASGKRSGWLAIIHTAQIHTHTHSLARTRALIRLFHYKWVLLPLLLLLLGADAGARCCIEWGMFTSCLTAILNV